MEESGTINLRGNKTTEFHLSKALLMMFHLKKPKPELTEETSPDPTDITLSQSEVNTVRFPVYCDSQ